MNHTPIDDGGDPPSLDFLLPFGEDLAVLLKQPYITVSALKQVLRARGVYMLTNEKNDLIEPLLLGFLSPGEFDFLFSFARSREESDKLRTSTYEVKDSSEDLESALPVISTAIADDPYGNYKVLGAPALIKESQADQESYVWKYRVRRLNLTSDYLHTYKIFPAELRITKKKGSTKLIIQSYHTSDETEATNRLFKRAFVKGLKKSNYIEDEETNVVRFSDFTNEERVRFFMGFTEFPSRTRLRFEEFSDFSIKVDPSAKIPDGISMTWMRERVSTLKLAGKGLHSVFLLSELDCRPHIFLWKVDVRLTLDTADGDVSATAVIEFSGFGKARKKSAPFQISIDSLKLKGCKAGSKEYRDLVRKISIILNDHKELVFTAIKSTTAADVQK
ncbi:MAG: hypothetical protein EOP84_03875 [Verrucomicrobiaceae bacterium]|nr:MAG: hypothetical protein EOP84_03875 [Verrucomicrobiaceae bacterium]